MTSRLKKSINKLPVWVQHSVINRIRRTRHLPGINRQKRIYNAYNKLTVDQQKDWIFHKVKTIALYAQKNNKFYSEYYETNNFDASSLNHFSEIDRIPIVTKEDLRNAGSSWMRQKYSVYSGNTGGTSGSPLTFNLSMEILDKEAFYINKIFQSLGCGRDDGRLVFRGINILDNKPVEFVLSEDAYLLNLYRSFYDVRDNLEEFFDKNKINYLHGYPSAIYQLSIFCQRFENNTLLLKIRKYLKGVLMGSEFPAPKYREVIEEVFGVRSLSWYGHSEMTVLATEREDPYIYYPYQSYGFCEAIDTAPDRTNLIGTSFYHFNTPFIRYDTGDSIKLVSSEKGLLNSFKIADGRIGEYILDKDNHSIPLTALIFGRHHMAFDFVDFIQVSQNTAGKAVLHISISDHRRKVDLNQILNSFDLSSVSISFTINLRETPYRSVTGKVPLLIPSTEE